MEQVNFTAILNDVSENVKQNTNYRNTDYLDKDGLLCCGICQERKQVYMPVVNSDGKIELSDMIVHSLCRCDRDALDAEKKRLQYLALQKKCFSGQVMRDWKFENDNHQGDPKPMEKARTYAENFEEMLENNISLIFYGNPGSGKSFAAACIANAVMKQGHSCLMTNFPTIIRQMFQATNKDEYISNLCNCQLLILDDLFVEQSTEYALSIVWSVIDARIAQGYPMIITTNVTKQFLANPTTDKGEQIRESLQRICSRLTNAFPIAYNGTDRRKQEATGKFQKFRSLFSDES